jgi:hypothetical protein
MITSIHKMINKNIKLNTSVERLYWFLLFIFLSGKTFAGGLSAWQEDTPYGHSMDHDGMAGGWIYMQIDTTSVGFQQFYFYKGYTIAHSDSAFYIIDEKANHIQKFNSNAQWQKAIAEQNLKPLLKREYNSSYGIDKVLGPVFLLMAPFPLLLPLLWGFCLISLFFRWQRAKFFRKHYTWIYPTILLLVFLSYNVPQSF